MVASIKRTIIKHHFLATLINSYKQIITTITYFCIPKNKINVKIQQRNVGYLFQDYQLFPNMNVYKNITFMTEPSEHINNLIQTLNISHLVTQYPMTLSGGETQRVALARSLSTKPDLILLDEPFSSLDDVTKDESIALVQKIFDEWKIPIIFVTHSNYEAKKMAHEIVNIGNE